MASRPTSTDALEAESTEAQGSTEHRAPVPSPPTRAADAPTFAHALDAELTEIQSSREKRTRIPPSPRTPLPPIPTGTPENAHDRAADAELLGLAFSGGGIRSATFNLGILQGLAKYGLLPRFDYLSTVSGGGYIGSWLSAWIRRSGLAEVEKSLAGRAASVDQPEVPQISHLRQFSNYLTPKKGFFSADTWTMVSIYLRNLLLNLVILVTGLGAVLLIPRFVAGATGAAQGDPSDPAARYLIAAGLSLIVAIAFTARNVVSFKSDQTVQRRFRSQGMVQVAIVVPLFIASWCLAAGLQRLSGTPLDYGWWIAFGVGLLAGLDIIIRLSLGSSLSRAFGSAAALAAAASLIALELFLLRPCLRVGFAWSPVTGLNLLETLESQTLWGVPLLASAGLLGVIFYVGLMGRAFDTGVREWWARLVAWVLLYAAGWVVLFGVAFTGPEALDRLGGWAKTGLTSGWILSTLGGLVAGESSKSGGKKSQVVMSMMATAAPFVFVAGLLLALSALLEALVPGVWFLSAARLAIVFSALLALALLLSWRVDINEFSMHNFYRNRLLRCYAGASNKDRHEHPFTGFDASEHLIRVSDLRVKMPDDPNDAQRRASLKYGAKPYVGPYHIVNAALNLVGSKNLAWQQRKASSFVFAPLYSGYEIPAPGQSWRPTEQFDNGLSLGTAMAISGAAASPNMGYHSSSALTFLMMVFNVRLGWWLGNPRRDDSWPRSGPRIGIFCMIRELMGMTDEDYKYVYLSDGGHFENLGIYELVRRRCQFIVSCDAGADPGLEFGDLGNAIEKCRTDFGVDIEIDVTSIRRPANASYSSAHCAVGKIRYDKIAPNMPPGTLLYIKASLTSDEPTDVLRYHAQNAAFPHQGTGDQFFDETQFESYRALGSHVLDEVLDAVGSESVVEETHTDDLFLKLRQSWYPPSAAITDNFTRHAAAVDQIYRDLRTNEDLAFLSGQIYPEWRDLVVDKKRCTPVSYELPDDCEHIRAGFYVCNQVMQVMESVYLDLHLDQEYNHPDNRGWMNYFRHWSWSSMFRVTWAISASTYGARFQSFCRRRLDLDLGSVSVRLVHERVRRDWDELERAREINFFERDVLRHLVDWDSTSDDRDPTSDDRDPRNHKLYRMQLDVSTPAMQKETTLPFGVALLYGAELRFFRIQDHVRKMGLARRALEALIQAEKGLEVHPEFPYPESPVKGFKYPTDPERRAFGRVLESVRAQRHQEGR